MDECGLSLGEAPGMGTGGIWLPHRGGGVDFKEVFCNAELQDGERPGSHPGKCRYLDPLSGLVVTPAKAATRHVDSRGCVHDAAG